MGKRNERISIPSTHFAFSIFCLVRPPIRVSYPSLSWRVWHTFASTYPQIMSSNSAHQPHRAPEYMGAGGTPISSAAPTLHNGYTPERKKFKRNHTGSSQTVAEVAKQGKDVTSNDVAEQPSTTFVEPQRTGQRRGSRVGGAPFPTLGQQISHLARQTSICSNADPDRPPSPQFPHAALSLTRSVSAPGATYIDWEEGDPECPMYWPKTKQWAITAVCALFAGVTSFVAVGYDSASAQVQKELGVSETVFLLGNTTYLGAVALAPLVLAPFSELFGRKWIFNVSAFLTAALMIPQALATNIYAILIPRLFAGIVASCGNSLVGGILSDIFPSHERGLPMSIFALTIFFSQGVAPLCAAFTVAEQGWRVAFWWQMGLCFLPWVLMMFIFDETRGPVLLSWRAARMTKECGGKIIYRCRADDEKTSVAEMVKTSISRPLVFLTTEPIVTSFSLWIGTLWGTTFLSIAAVPIAFGEAYGWSQEQASIVLLILAAGGALGWIINLWQEYMYQRAVQKYNGEPPPEVRLYSSCIGAVLVPVGLFWYAWGAQPHVHPAVPIIGLVIFAAGVFLPYLGVFIVLAGIYGRYASSALAAQSLMRNLIACVSPLWTPAMYHNLGAPYATTILACIAALLGCCPFILLIFGPSIRARSRIAKEMQKEEEEFQEVRRLEKEKEERRQRRQEQKEKMLNGNVLPAFGQQQPPKHDLESQKDPAKDMEKVALARDQS